MTCPRQFASCSTNTRSIRVYGMTSSGGAVSQACLSYPELVDDDARAKISLTPMMDCQRVTRRTKIEHWATWDLRTAEVIQEPLEIHQTLNHDAPLLFPAGPAQTVLRHGSQSKNFSKDWTWPSLAYSYNLYGDFEDPPISLTFAQDDRLFLNILRKFSRHY